MRDLALHVTRAVDDADAAALAAIDAASFPHPTLDLAGELARSFARLWLAREGADDGPIVGFLLAWLVADEVHVLTVATAPDHRRRGVARAMPAAASHLAQRAVPSGRPPASGRRPA